MQDLYHNSNDIIILSKKASLPFTSNVFPNHTHDILSCVVVMEVANK